MRPSRSSTTRSARAATAGSCVTTTIACPPPPARRGSPAPRARSRCRARRSARRRARSPGGARAPGRSRTAAAAAGELVRAAALEPCHTEVGEQRGDARRVGRPAGEQRGQLDVLERGQARHQVERLEHHAHLLAAQGRQRVVVEPHDRGAADDDIAGARRVEPGGEVQQGRLAGAGRPHDGGEGAGSDLEVEPVEGRDGGGAVAEALGDGAEPECVLVHAPSQRMRGTGVVRRWSEPASSAGMSAREPLGEDRRQQLGRCSGRPCPTPSTISGSLPARAWWRSRAESRMSARSPAPTTTSAPVTLRVSPTPPIRPAP